DVRCDGEPGRAGCAAIRTEKLRLDRDEAAAVAQSGAENGVVATVVDIGYLGNLSLYRLRTEAGVPLQAAIANTGPLTARAIGWNERGWLSFAPEAAVVLTR